MRHRHHRRPPWWPANEPWPPRHARHGGRRFFRRMAVARSHLVSERLAPARLSEVAGGYAIGGAHVVIVPAAGFAITLPVALLVADCVARRSAWRHCRGGESRRRRRYRRVSIAGAPSLRVVGSAFNTMASRREAQDR